MWQMPLPNTQLQKYPALATPPRAARYAARSARGGVLAWPRVHGGPFGSAPRAVITASTQQSCFGSRVSFSISTRLCPYTGASRPCEPPLEPRRQQETHGCTGRRTEGAGPTSIP